MSSASPPAAGPRIEGPLERITAPSAGAVCNLYELTDEAAELLDPQAEPATFLARLIDAGLLIDSTQFLARALPAREATWWICLVAVEADAASDDERDAQLRGLAEQWVREPQDETGRQAFALADERGFESASSWAAAAAFWGGGSLAPADVAPVPPPPGLTGTAVGTGVVVAAVRREPERHEEKLRRYLSMGIDIAAGGSGQI